MLNRNYDKVEKVIYLLVDRYTESPRLYSFPIVVVSEMLEKGVAY